jgi:hypothetical protein
MSQSDNRKTDQAQVRNPDTASYEQPHGDKDSKAEPNRRNEKLPHERDESAKSTGNRLDQKVPPSERQISQAQDDVDAGQLDTDRRGVPNDVPTDKR